MKGLKVFVLAHLKKSKIKIRKESIFTYLILGSWKKLNSLYYEKYGYTFSLVVT